jgi:hypothetical protein
MGIEDTLKEIIGSSLTPEEQADVPSQFAAMGAIKKDQTEGMSARDILYKSLTAQNDKLEGKKRDLLMQMNDDSPMSKSQVAAMMLIGILPILAGGAVKGKQGLAAGAEAGAIGATTMAKGIEADQGKKQKRAMVELEGVTDAMAKNQDLQGKSLLDEAKAGENAVQKDLDRQNRVQTAGMHAAGMAKGLSSIGKSLDNIAKGFKNEKLAEESKDSAKAVTTGDDDLFLPQGRVNDKKAGEVTSAAGLYKTAIDEVHNLIQMSKNMDAPMFERMAGNKSDEMYKHFITARNAIKEAKRLPGNNSSKVLGELDELLKSPTSWINNIKAMAVPGAADIQSQLDNTEKVMLEDYKRYLQGSGYTKIKKGTITQMKNGKTVRITDVLPNGQIQWEAYNPPVTPVPGVDE